MASRGSVFWVLSALTLCSKFGAGTALEARLGCDGLEFLSTTAESTHTNNVADQLPAFDESLFEWETLTSKDGAPYRVGRKKAVVTEPLSTDVNWPADGKWKKSSSEVFKSTGIRTAQVYIPELSKFRYVLDFIAAVPANYSFKTQTGESFDVPKGREGPNIVGYNAKNPTIVKVTINRLL